MSDDWCVVGLTPMATAAGIEHVDGSACAITATEVVAAAEERFSRLTHAGGSELSLRAVLEAVGRHPTDIDMWVLSTCGEAPLGSPSRRSLGPNLSASLLDLGIEPDKVSWSPSHHLSHAYAASPLVTSGDLVVVVDDAGYEFEGSGTERGTAYLVRPDGSLASVATVRSASPGGLGTLYRDAAYRLGFSGATECGKVMALAAYDTQIQTTAGPLTCHEGTLAAPQAEEWMERVLLTRSTDRWSHWGRSWGDEHVYVAKAVQGALEVGLHTWLKSVLRTLVDLPGRIVFTGGVALNCRAMGFLGEELPGEFIVHHAPGDTGQSIGNAIIAARQLGTVIPKSVSSPFLGPMPRMSQIKQAAMMKEVRSISWLARNVASHTIAHAIDKGAVVGLFEGRSELGPRALGHRSILADPRTAKQTGRLNQLKGREPFRPFGLAIQVQHASWLTGTALASPFMLLAVNASRAARHLVPAGIHVDGSTRFQTVDEDIGLMFDLLGEWHSLTGVPALINTSFNVGGEPMVETAAQAVETGSRLGLDVVALVVGSQVALVELSEVTTSGSEFGQPSSGAG